MSIAAVVRSPSHAFLTSNVTATLLPSSETPVTEPTLTPAILTSFPGCSPAASANRAVYPLPPPMIGRSPEK